MFKDSGNLYDEPKEFMYKSMLWYCICETGIDREFSEMDFWELLARANLKAVNEEAKIEELKRKQ